MLTENAGRTDGQLLEDYLNRRDAQAFEALLQRHGGMVWGVCRRVLDNHHDAEDAFQATFLVLIRKAASIIPRDMVGNWLYGVAHQTALKARATAAKRKTRERQVAKMPEAKAPQHTLPSLVDEELSRLPDRYRAVIILCDLEGKTRREAAQHLGCPEGTVAGRLARARMLLARRLARHGLAVSGGALAGSLSQLAAAAPSSVVTATIELAADECLARGSVAALVEGVLKTMFLKKATAISAVLLAVGISLFAGSSLGPSGPATVVGGEKVPRRPDVPMADVPRARVEVLVTGVIGMKIQVPGRRAEVPARIDLAPGKLHRLKLFDVPNRPGVERFASVEIPQTTSATEPFLAASAIPIEFIDRDFAAVDDGTAITKVVCLEADGGKAIAIASYDVPGVDVIAEARRHGAILAVVRMANIALPADAGRLVEIEIGDDGTKGRVERVDAAQFAKQLEILQRDAETVQAQNKELRERLMKAELQVRSLENKLAAHESRDAVSLTFTHAKLPVNSEVLGPLLRQMAWDKYQDARLTIRTTRPVETLTLIGSKESVEWATGVIKALNAAK
jgi:RNA polymerase sigma factor (sigma-70 family)